MKKRIVLNLVGISWSSMPFYGTVKSVQGPYGGRAARDGKCPKSRQ